MARLLLRRAVGFEGGALGQLSFRVACLDLLLQPKSLLSTIPWTVVLAAFILGLDALASTTCWSSGWRTARTWSTTRCCARDGSRWVIVLGAGSRWSCT